MNITGFASVQLKKDRDDGDRLEFHGKYWEMNNITMRSEGKDAITKSNFRMKLFNDSMDYDATSYWKGWRGDDKEEWIWDRRFCKFFCSLLPNVAVSLTILKQSQSGTGTVLLYEASNDAAANFSWALAESRLERRHPVR